MRNRFMLGATAAALLVIVAAVASSTAAAASKTATFNIVEKDIGFNFIDNPPKQGFKAPPLIGDQLAFSANLTTKSGAHTGMLEATCMVALGGTRAEGPCYGVYALKGGTLMAMAQTKFYGNAPTNIVIVGGTGVYEGVTGSIHSVTVNDNTNADTVTLHWSS
jgi:hypothetical protein